jgi:hypothetical protein
LAARRKSAIVYTISADWVNAKRLPPCNPEAVQFGVREIPGVAFLTFEFRARHAHDLSEFLEIGSRATAEQEALEFLSREGIVRANPVTPKILFRFLRSPGLLAGSFLTALPPLLASSVLRLLTGSTCARRTERYLPLAIWSMHYDTLDREPSERAPHGLSESRRRAGARFFQFACDEPSKYGCAAMAATPIDFMDFR